MKNAIKKFLADEQGAETVEWVMIAAVLAGVIVATYGLSGGFRTNILDAFTNIGTKMTGTFL